MEQLDLFVESIDDEAVQLQDLDYVLVKEEGGYRLAHSFYRDSRVGKVITAEEALDAMSLCASFNLYTVVAFSDTLNLPRRNH